MVSPTVYAAKTLCMNAQIMPALGTASHYAPISGVKGFFTNRNNKMASFVRGINGVDKTIKTAMAVCDLGREITKSKVDLESSHDGFNNAFKALSGARSVLGLFNVFNGAIPSAISDGKAAVYLVRDFCSGEKDISPLDGTSFNPEKIYLHNKLAIGKQEQGLAAFATGMRSIAASTFIVSFGVFRSCAWVNKMTPFLGRHALGMGLAANTLMVVNHLAVLSGTVAELVREKRCYSRIKEFVNNDQEISLSDRTNVGRGLFFHYRSIVVNHILTLVEKFIEFFLDFVKGIVELGACVPLEARAGLSIFIGLVGIYKVWLSLDKK